MHINVKALILIFVFIIFIIAIIICRDANRTAVVVSLISSMVLLVSGIDSLIPKNDTEQNKVNVTKFVDRFVNKIKAPFKVFNNKNNCHDLDFANTDNTYNNDNNNKEGFQNQLNDGFDTAKTTDLIDADNSIYDYDLETRYYIDPDVIDADKEMLDINDDGLVDQEELMYAAQDDLEDKIDYTNFDDLRTSIDVINEEEKIKKMRQKEIDDYMKLTPEEKDNYYKYKQQKEYAIQRKYIGDTLHKPNCHDIQPSEEEVQAFKIFDYIRSPGRLVDDRAADLEYRHGRRDIRAKTGMMEYGRRLAMLTEQVSDVDQRREWWNDNAALDVVLLAKAKQKFM